MLNVLMLSHHLCIRVIKYALALMTRDDVNVFYMQTDIANKDCKNLLSNTTYYATQQQLKVKLHTWKQKVDLIHCHNQPDWMAQIAKEVLPDVPLICDTHDLFSQMDNQLDLGIQMEKKALGGADAYIFVSKPQMEEAVRFHNIPESKPRMVVHSYANIEMMMMKPLPRIRGIAYEGNVHTEDAAGAYQRCRDHQYLVKYLTMQNIPIALYGVDNPAIIKQYVDLGAMVYGVYPYMQMLNQLSRYDWCFVGSTEPTRTLENAMPNKLFESIIMGVPVIVCNAPTAGAFVEEHGLGVNIHSVHEIPEIYPRHEELRKNVLEKRHQFVMEGQLDELINFYREVAGKAIPDAA